MNPRLILGIDVTEETVTGATSFKGQVAQVGSFANTPKGWKALGTAVAARTAPATVEVVLVVEPSGGHEVGLVLWALRQPGWHVHWPDQAQVLAWATSQGLRAKTDRQDALLLAQYGAAQPDLPSWRPLPRQVSDLECLLDQRNEVADLLRLERSRAQQSAERPRPSLAVLESHVRLIRGLTEALDSIQGALAEYMLAYRDPQP